MVCAASAARSWPRNSARSLAVRTTSEGSLLPFAAQWMRSQIGAIRFDEQPPRGNRRRGAAEHLEFLVGVRYVAGEAHVQPQGDTLRCHRRIAAEGVQDARSGPRAAASRSIGIRSASASRQ